MNSGKEFQEFITNNQTNTKGGTMKKLLTMKTFKTVITALSIVGLSGCGGGGGGNYSTGGVYFTHAELASEFVRRVNVDLAGYDIQLMKTNTLQTDYIVVYDYDFNTYDAYWLGNYNPGENLYNYISNYQDTFYYGLTPEAGNTYRDYATGVLFHAPEGSSKNIAAAKALKQQLVIDKAADGLIADYGMSESAAHLAASFAYNLKTSPKGTYDTKDYDAFAKELVGSSITEFNADLKAGNILSLNDRLALAVEKTGMDSQGIRELIKEGLPQ